MPATALCSALAEVFTWLTDDTTAWTVVREGWACAAVTADCRPDSELRSAVVCDEYADFASLANVFASAWTLPTAVFTEPRSLTLTVILPRS